ncbi:heterokaryon incompatibility protein [Hirsutella rhossiliensis]
MLNHSNSRNPELTYIYVNPFGSVFHLNALVSSATYKKNWYNRSTTPGDCGIVTGIGRLFGPLVRILCSPHLTTSYLGLTFFRPIRGLAGVWNSGLDRFLTHFNTVGLDFIRDRLEAKADLVRKDVRDRLRHHHKTLAGVQQSVVDQCFICNVVWRDILGYRCPPKEGGTPIRMLELTMIADKNGLEHGGPAHTFCLQPLKISIKQYPTRLMEIDKPTSNKIRLVQDTTVLEPNLQYTTLSHCWGGTHALRLTTETKESLENGIPIPGLGKTFHDAIVVARKMGIPLIWIDSLCIAQDSKRDWQNEAPKMADIYGGALLNIAATSSENTNAGFLPGTKGRSLQPFVVQLEGTEFPEGRYSVSDRQYRVKAFKNMPLMKRAWVVQEFLLAPRVLHFCGNEMFWECFELDACETYPSGLPQGLDQHWIARDIIWSVLRKSSRFTINTVNIVNTVDNGNPISLLWEMWREIIRVYTSCGLTYASDKLIAISAIAKLIQRAFNIDYCAGLWRHQLEYQLLWTSHNSSSEPRYPPLSYRAPTWSWASMDGSIVLSRFQEDDNRWKSAITIVDCHIDMRTKDPTGEILGGFLRVSGFLATMRLTPEEEKPGQQNDIDQCKIFANGQWIQGGLPHHIYFDEKATTDEILVHALPIVIDTREDQPGLIVFLLLRSTGNARGQFYRTGVMYGSFGSLGIDGKDFGELGRIADEPWMEYISSEKVSPRETSQNRQNRSLGRERLLILSKALVFYELRRCYRTYPSFPSLFIKSEDEGYGHASR